MMKTKYIFKQKTIFIIPPQPQPLFSLPGENKIIINRVTHMATGHSSEGMTNILESCPPCLTIQLPCLLSIAGSRQSSLFHSTYFYLAKEKQDGIKVNSCWFLSTDVDIHFAHLNEIRCINSAA